MKRSHPCESSSETNRLPGFCSLWCEDVCGRSFNDMGPWLSRTVHLLPALAASFIVSSSVHRAQEPKTRLFWSCPAFQSIPKHFKFRCELRHPQAQHFQISAVNFRDPPGMIWDSLAFHGQEGHEVDEETQCQSCQRCSTHADAFYTMQLTTMSGCYAQPIAALTNFTLCSRIAQINLFLPHTFHTFHTFHSFHNSQCFTLVVQDDFDLAHVRFACTLCTISA